MQWIEYRIFVNSPENIEELILSFIKELKERFLNDGLIDVYHFLRYIILKEQQFYVRFRVGTERDIDRNTIENMVREKSKEYDYIERIENPEFSSLDSNSQVRADIFAKFLFYTSEISLSLLGNKEEIPNWHANLSEFMHCFLNQLGFNYLDEINFYAQLELERFSVMLQPEKFQKIREICDRRTKEINDEIKEGE